ncbi:ABC transporter permease [Peredibacter starrii]|uniref:ABC transporter permease n=1 Tax=Peredibacter starrii TaxID=28202 RepID=A0AAX4HRK1_9BACT|nr:ABC transporter permease [Peredibacter starrii]WPU65980.1 ABC transporter permease [Peredibacter starrii]
MKENSLWKDAFKRLIKDKWAFGSLIIVAIYSIVAILAATGLLAADWAREVGASNLPPSAEHWFGTDIFGRDVLAKVLHGTQIAMSVGLATSLIAIPIGVILGALAGYFGGWVDDVITWLYTTFSSIPNIMLLISITMILGKGLFAVYIALGATSWVTLCRLIRGEVMKHKEREYVQAAGAIGGGHFRKLFLHILPNVTHIVIINTSLQFQFAIKSEVILSYLGLGVQGEPSWGTMIDDAKLELARGVWWQLAGATTAMFIVVLAFNLLGDALRDALDPKLKGK